MILLRRKTKTDKNSFFTLFFSEVGSEFGLRLGGNENWEWVFNFQSNLFRHLVFNLSRFKIGYSITMEYAFTIKWYIDLRQLIIGLLS